MNGRFGLAPFRPLPMIEEYVAVVRAVLAGDPAGFAGQLFRTGMVPLDSPPVRSGLPVYLAALGPQMLALAGRIADGVILNLMSPPQAGRLPASSARPRRRRAGTRPRSRSSVWCIPACPPMRPQRRTPPARSCRATSCIRRWARSSARMTPPKPAGGQAANSGRRPGGRRGAGAAAGRRRLCGPRGRRHAAAAYWRPTVPRAWTCPWCSPCQCRASGATRGSSAR